MSKSSSKPASTPSKPNHLIPGREGGKPSATPPAKTHREPGQGQVRVKE
jgi:hypothetical protein